MKRLGPELKMPEMKVPKVLTDLYGDLRDRRLLPLVALLIVGIVAAPILLRESAPEEEPATGGATVTKKTKYAQISVVEATPGLRDYHKRLKGKPTDPFGQKYTAPVLTGADLPESSESGEAGEDTGSGGGSDSGGSGSGGSGSGGSGGKVKYYEWVIKIQISRTETDGDGKTEMGPPKTRDGVKSLTPLPGKKAPVITFIGVNPKNGKALVSVSSEVSSTFGEAHCVAGADRCDLLELEPGFPVTFEYGVNAVRYRFKLIKIDLVPAGKS